MRDKSVSGTAAASRRYAAAFLAVAAAFALTQTLWPWVAPHPTPLFLAAVMLSALYGGLGPSLLGSMLAALVINYFLVPPTASFELSVDDAVRAAVFIAAALLISWVDAARIRAEAALRRHAMQQAAVAELGQRALLGATTLELADIAVSVLARRLGAESAALWEFRPEDESLRLRASVGWTAEFVEHATAGARPTSMLGCALSATEPIVVNNAQTVPHEGEAFELGREAHSRVSVAVAGRGEPFGVLSAYTDSPRGFTAEDVHFVQAVANVLSAAVERAPGDVRSPPLARADKHLPSMRDGEVLDCAASSS